jgi:glycosyltransferase involved in cell wall biosynthesis
MADQNNGRSESLKIAQVVSTPPFAWATGGCARVTYDLSRALAKQGHSVDILSMNILAPGKRSPNRTDPQIIEGVRIFYFPCFSEWLAWKYKFYFSPQLQSFIKYRVKDYDIIHLEDLISPLAIATAKYCIRNDIPYILTTHGSLPWLKEPRLINRLFSRFFAIKILKNASKIFVLNLTEAELCKSFGIDDDRIEIIPNGLNISEYEHLPQKGEFKKKFGIRADEKIVLYLGRIHISKGIDLLVDAFSNVLKDIPNTRLIIAGPDDGYLGEFIKQINERGICDNVVVTSFLSPDDKLTALVDADVLVIPKFTGFPVTFLEACACQLPIVTTSAGDKLPWIDNNIGIVTSYDKLNLERAILKILQNEDLKIAFKNNERKMIEYFSWTSIVKNIEAQYFDALRDR